MGIKLELTWPGKDDGYALIRDDVTGKPRRVPYAEVQPRLLIEEACVGDPSDENMLIAGENLFALKTLKATEVAGGVKLIYIDPPFNTGRTFSHYDDGVALSLYLTMMYDRLRLLRDLLASNGVIFVHLDSNAVFHVKMLLDELFGRDRFINDIIWKRTDSHKSARKAAVIHDTILVYSREPLYAWRDLYLPYSDERLRTAYRNQDATGRRYTISDLMAPGDRAGTKADYEWRGIRPRAGRHWSYPLETMLELEQQGRIVWNKNGVPKLKVYLDEAKGVPLPSVWTDIGMLKGGTEARGFDTQKPEGLIQRILSMVTDPGDLVLDCFLGSGTTAAVAHKMQRRWIGIEAVPTSVELITARLTAVVHGTDAGGISSQVPPHPARIDQYVLPSETIHNLGWTGGGGFTVYRLGKALIERDAAFGVWRLNYDNGLLIEAVCLHEGFRLLGDPLKHGQRGRHFAHITDQFVTQGLIDSLDATLHDDESLTIYCLKAADGLACPDTLDLQRIPQALHKERTL